MKNNQNNNSSIALKCCELSIEKSTYYVHEQSMKAI